MSEQIEQKTDQEAEVELTGDAAVEGKTMPLMEHLMELRNRLLWCIGFLVVAFVGCYLIAEDIYGFLVQPLTEAFEGQSGRRLIFTALHEAFFTYLKVALFGALCLTLPVILWQLYAFVAPGLYKNEKGGLRAVPDCNADLVHHGGGPGLLSGHPLGLEFLPKL